MLLILSGCLVLALAYASCGGEAAAPATAPEQPVTAVAAPAPAPAALEATPTKRPVPEGRKDRAPELAGITGWINSEPFTLESQRGKVVLIDFWTYTCVNCIRTLPYLRSWHAKYADKGLVVLGVHSPEFEFEKVRENVVQAMERYGIKYAVAQDNKLGTWRAYENRFWPSKYLIDKDGYIRYTHHGEGKYEETEQKIRELLEETGADLSDVSPETAPAPAVAVPDVVLAQPTTGLTRELYAGFERNYTAINFGGAPPYIAHDEYYDKPVADVLYKDPGSHQNHFIYLQGLWRNEAESLVHARQTQDYEDYIGIKFIATSVNAVMAPVDATPVDVRLTMDGKPLAAGQAGPDVVFDSGGNSYVRVDQPRMYRLVELPEYGAHELKLGSNSPEMSLFAFTFGAYVTGP